MIHSLSTQLLSVTVTHLFDTEKGTKLVRKNPAYIPICLSYTETIFQLYL